MTKKNKLTKIIPTALILLATGSSHGAALANGDFSSGLSTAGSFNDVSVTTFTTGVWEQSTSSHAWVYDGTNEQIAGGQETGTNRRDIIQWYTNSSETIGLQQLTMDVDFHNPNDSGAANLGFGVEVVGWNIGDLAPTVDLVQGGTSPVSATGTTLNDGTALLIDYNVITSKSLTAAVDGFQSISFDVDFGTGYDFLYVRLMNAGGSNDDPGFYVDNVAIAPDPSVILFTSFDVTTKSELSQEMTNIVWTNYDLVSVTPNTSVTTTASNNDGYFTTGYGATAFAPDQNTINEGPWSATFELTFNGAATGTLESVTFNYQGLGNTGALQAANFMQPQDATVTVNGALFDAATTFAAGSSSGLMTLTDTAALNNGANAITITVAEIGSPTGGYNMAIDNLTLRGAITPVDDVRLVITPSGTPGNYDFSWNSQVGKVYDLVSDLGLDTPPSSWAVWEGHVDVATNTLMSVPGGGDAERFFAIIEKEAP